MTAGHERDAADGGHDDAQQRRERFHVVDYPGNGRRCTGRVQGNRI